MCCWRPHSDVSEDTYHDDFSPDGFNDDTSDDTIDGGFNFTDDGI